MPTPAPVTRVRDSPRAQVRREVTVWRIVDSNDGCGIGYLSIFPLPRRIREPRRILDSHRARHGELLIATELLGGPNEALQSSAMLKVRVENREHEAARAQRARRFPEKELRERRRDASFRMEGRIADDKV